MLRVLKIGENEEEKNKSKKRKKGIEKEKLRKRKRKKGGKEKKKKMKKDIRLQIWHSFEQHSCVEFMKTDAKHSNRQKKSTYSYSK